MSKQVINIHAYDTSNGTRYKVHSLTNRIEPKIGFWITETELKSLIDFGKRPGRNISVNISMGKGER